MRYGVSVLLFCLLLMMAFTENALCKDIFEASSEGDIATVKALLKKNPKLALTKNGSGTLPIHEAAYRGQKEVVAFFLAQGVPVDAKDSEGNTPLHWTVKWCANNKGTKPVIDLLVSKGAKINTRNKDGATPLLTSVTPMDRFCLSKDIPEYLIKKGADVNIADNEGVTPLEYVLSDGQDNVDDKDNPNAVAILFIAKGANINGATGKGSPLHGAASSGNLKMAALLIGKGAKVNARGQDGRSPLHSAAWNGKDKMVELLVSKGADVNAKDDKGKKPADYAKEEGWTNIVDYLKKHGAK